MDFGRKNLKEKAEACGLVSENKKRKTGMRILRIVFCVFLAVSVGTAGAAAGAYAGIIDSAPDISEINIMPQGNATFIYDDQGTLIRQLNSAGGNRISVSIEEIPENMQHAIVAIEDSRFYEHNGVDSLGMLRALATAFGTGFSRTEGASTITQQLLKNNVFTDWMQESTVGSIVRKLQEQYLAVELEKYLTAQGKDAKSVILENYLNTVNFGAGAYGVQTAARTYFGKDCRDLTLSECAVLAAIPQNPSRWNPKVNPEENAERRGTVLAYMLEQEWITEEEYQEALADHVYDRILENAEQETEAEPYSYFIDELIVRVQRDLVEKAGYTEAQAANAVYSGGLRIYSTQDSHIQQILEEEFQDPENYPQGNGSELQPQAAMTVIRQDSGQVKGIVGGLGEKTASLTLNRASDTARQPGSTFKILSTYGPALETGSITLATKIQDEPYEYSDGTPLHNSDGRYHGRVTVREAIENSYNVPAVKVLTDLTPQTGFNYLLRLGFTTLDQELDVIQPLALGGVTNGVSNLELTAAYAAIADGGIYREPTFYTRVTDREGNVILDGEHPEERRVFKESTAFLLTSAMESVLEEGTGVPFQLEDMTAAGKTGTTTYYKDLVFAGFTPYYTAAIWAGFDENIELPEEYRSYHQTLWRNVMNRIHEDLPDREFLQPSSVERVTICADSGLLAGSGCDRVTEYFETSTAPEKRCTQHRFTLFPTREPEEGEEEEEEQEGGNSFWDWLRSLWD